MNTSKIILISSARVFQSKLLVGRIIFNYSLDFYSIEIPLIPLKQIFRLLNVLPYGKIFSTDEKHHIWAVLTPQDAEWVRREFGWIVKRIVLYKIPEKFTFSWFDSETQNWSLPKVLKTSE